MSDIRSNMQAQTTPGPELSFGPFAALACALCLIGVLLRTYLYAHHATFWMDEAMVAVNVRGASWRQLFGALPYYDQAAPLLYLLLYKLLFVLLGATDWIARLLPFTTGILILIVALRTPELSRWERLGFVSLLAFNPDLIRYSAEAKQYGPEALVSLLFYIASKKLTADPNRRTIALYLVAGAACVTSVTLFPLLFAASIAPIAVRLWRNPMRWQIAIAAGLLFAFYSGYYLLMVRPSLVYQTSNYSFTYASFPRFVGTGLGGLIRQLGGEFLNVFGLSAGRLTGALFVVALLLAVLIRRSFLDFEVVAVTALFLSCLALNLLHILPIENRRWFVFLIPWTSAFCVVAIARLPRGLLIPVMGLFVICMIYETGVYCITLPLGDSRRTLTYLQENGDVQKAMTTLGSQPLLDFYYSPFSQACISQSLLDRGFVNRCTAHKLPYARTMDQLRRDAALPGVWSDFDAATLAGVSESIRNDDALLQSGFTQLSVDYRADLVKQRASSPQVVVLHVDPELWIHWFTDALNRRGLTTSVIVNERTGRGREIAGELLLVKSVQ